MSKSSGPFGAASGIVSAPGGPQTVWIPDGLLDALRRVSVDALPRQAYGLLGGADLHHPLSLYPCSTNLRHTPEWTRTFEEFGEFYRDPDRGFVIAPDEVLGVVKRMAARGESPVGVFHSHRYRAAEPSPADLALGGGSGLLSYIVSVVSRDAPDVRVFRLLDRARYDELSVVRVPPSAVGRATRARPAGSARRSVARRSRP